MNKVRPQFYLVGNHLAADFANTIRSKDTGEESLRDWPDLIYFLEEKGIIARQKMQSLLDLSVSVPQESGRAFEAALALRGAIRNGLDHITNRHVPPEECVRPINSILRLTEGYDQLVATGNSWTMQYVQREKRLEWLLAAIARAGAELLVEGLKAPVRKCANPKCVLYFYDTSRTGRRRWCSMAACGNRSKVAAFSRRSRNVSGRQRT